MIKSDAQRGRTMAQIVGFRQALVKVEQELLRQQITEMDVVLNPIIEGKDLLPGKFPKVRVSDSLKEAVSEFRHRATAVDESNLAASCHILCSALRCSHGSPKRPR